MKLIPRRKKKLKNTILGENVITANSYRPLKDFKIYISNNF